jgi:hypothetical protein
MKPRSEDNSVLSVVKAMLTRFVVEFDSLLRSDNCTKLSSNVLTSVGLSR